MIDVHAAIKRYIAQDRPMSANERDMLMLLGEIVYNLGPERFASSVRWQERRDRLREVMRMVVEEANEPEPQPT